MLLYLCRSLALGELLTKAVIENQSLPFISSCASLKVLTVGVSKSTGKGGRCFFVLNKTGIMISDHRYQGDDF